MWYIWPIIALLCALIELFTPGFLFLCLGVGFLAALPVALLGLSFSYQICAIIIFDILILLFIRPLLLKITNKNGKTNIDRMIGRVGVLEEEIREGMKGSIRFDGVSWPASSSKEIKKGSFVIVKGVSGITLIVEEK